MGSFVRVGMGLMCGLAAQFSVAQDDFSSVEYSSVPVIDGLVMLQGAGGNIGVSSGDSGLLVIDDDYEGMGDKLAIALADFDTAGAKFVLNTHWHLDHAGTNPAMGRDGAVIVAHDNARSRLKSGGEIKAFGRVVPPADRSALPVITFAQSMSLHWNGLRLELDHPNPAHTDGDAVVYFYRDDQLKAVHAGDLFFNGFYPFVDVSSGGSAMGMVEGVANILARIDDATVVIPGHGPLASKADLQVYHDFLKSAVAAIAALKSQGKTLEQVIAAKPVAQFEEQWGDGFLKTDVWVGIIYAAI